MNTQGSSRGASRRTSQPASRKARAKVPRPVMTFEVDEYGTLRMRGVPDPETHADLYPDVEPSDIRNGRDAARLMDQHPGFACRVQDQVQEELDSVEAAIDGMPEDSPHRAALRLLQQRLADAADDPGPWLESLPEDQLDRVRDALAAWLAAPIDWYACEIPMHAGAQGEALSWFEDLATDDLEALGVVLVYGEHPGSSYYGAELKGEIDAANEAAARLGLDIRFVPEGEAAETQPAPSASTPPPPAERPVPLTVVPPLPVTPGVAGYAPLFGRKPDIVWMNHVYVHDAVPERGLRHLHFTWLFQMAWQRIVETIREPVQVCTDDEGRRHVHVLRAAVYTVEPDGRLSGRLWRPNAGMAPVLEPLQPSTLTVDTVPWGWRWMDHWQAGFEFEVASQAEGQRVRVVRQEVQAYAQWAFGLFRGRIRRGCDLRVMRGRIARALALDPLALAVARQLSMAERHKSARMALYNRAVDHLAAHRRLVADAPGLQLSYALLGHGSDALAGAEPAEDEPLQRLRRRVKAHGLSLRVYRLLLAGGTRLWRPMLRFYARGNAVAAWDYLGLIDDMGWRALPDAAFMQLVLAQCGSADRRRERYAGLFAEEMRALRSIVERYEALDAAGRESMRAQLPQVLTWLGKDDAAPLRGRGRLPAWATLVRRAQVFERDRLRLAALDAADLPVLRLEGPPDADSPFEVVLLGSAEALCEEGQAMRHCALNLAADCAEGRSAVASVRDRRTGQRVATALWRRGEAGWTLAELVGFANGPAPPLAQALCGRLRILDQQPTPVLIGKH